jgi:hypothetical protein
MAEELHDDSTAEERADYIYETLKERAVRDELSRRHGWPLGLSRDEILDRLLALNDCAPVDGDTQT